MKSLYLFVCLLTMGICFCGKSQNTSNENSSNIEWQLEIEKLLFERIMAYDSDSIGFIEAYLVFRVRSGNVVEKSSLMVGGNQIDDILNINMLYSHPFFVTHLQKFGNKDLVFFIQPIIFGKTKDIKDVVTLPSFYRLSTIPISPIFNEKDHGKTIFLFDQINYTYRVGK